MISFKQRVNDFLQSCPLCSSLWKSPNKPFCTFCEKNLLQRWTINKESLLENSSDSGFKIISLFAWSGDDRIQNQLLYNLKGDKLRLAWRFFAAEFARRMLIRKIHQTGIEQMHPSIQIVSAPNRINTRLHSQYWADGLSHFLKLPHVQILKEVRPSENLKMNQKLKTKDERRKIEFARIENSNKLDTKDTKIVIFADDVVTTAATANAARVALGLKPSEFEVWCLSYRIKKH